MADLTGKTLLNRYHINSLIGHGGMGDVYKAWDSVRAVFIALKVLHEDMAEDKVFLRRFSREAETLLALQHPHIVRFYGLEHDGRLTFMLMDYVEGTTLRGQIFDSQTPFTSQQVLNIIKPICSALHYAHNMGRVHCDIKPANIMVKSNGDIIVADFGIARMLETATTTTMAMAGTPAYMSPEQVRGQKPTPQTDIYALGIVIYEMLTGGERPFTGEQATIEGSTSEKVRWEQNNLKPPSPREYNPAISSEMEKVVLKCLDKEPVRRYTAVLELLNAVHIALDGVENIKAIEEERLQIAKEESNRESADEIAPEKVRSETAKRIAREEVEHEVAQKNKQVKLVRQSTRKAAMTKALNKLIIALKSILVQAKTLFRVVGLISIIIILFWGGSLTMPRLFSLMLNAKPSATIAPIITHVPPTKTLVPTAIKTKVPTSTPTRTPTPVPQSSILFQDNFEDGNADDWDPSDGTSWVVEKDESGNYVYEFTGPENYPQTWPGEGEWSDYAFESRIRIKKGTVFVLVRANGSSFYNVSINTSDISLARWNVNISEYKVVKSVKYPIQLNKWYLVRVEIVGQQYKLYIDNKLVTSYTYEDDSPVIKGGVGYYIGGGETVQIDDVKVWTLK